MSRVETTVLPDVPSGLLIGGEWGEAASGKRFATINPATEQVLAEVSEAGAAEIDAAVTAARKALRRGAWPMMTGADRGQILNELAAMLRERAEDVALLESFDAGKPLAAALRVDLPAAIDCLEYYAGWADKITGEVVPARRDALTYIYRIPVGVVAAIVPWNFPLMNAVWKIAPALACGCTVVLKPAELTPLSALWLGRAALEAGLPAGVLNIVAGFGGEAGAALVSHRDVDKIAFTGSPQTGQSIMRAAAEHVTRTGLELGGKSPSVVFDDANIDAAIRQTASGAFFTPGRSVRQPRGSSSRIAFTTPSSRDWPSARRICASEIPWTAPLQWDRSSRKSKWNACSVTSLQGATRAHKRSAAAAVPVMSAFSSNRPCSPTSPKAPPSLKKRFSDQWLR